MSEYIQICTYCRFPETDLSDFLHHDWHVLVNIIQTIGTDAQKEALGQLKCMPYFLKIDTNSSNY